MTLPVRFSKDQDNIVTLTLNSEGQRVNTLNDEMRDSLVATIERLVREKDSIAGVIFASAKSTFFAGGDLNYLYQLKAEDADQLFEQISIVKRAFRQLETLGKPVVAAINGSAVGGGFELALACHYRICIADPKIQLGLPEATLGLLPGLGGVVRMNLLLGLIESQSYLQEGRLFNPQHGFKAGLVDQLVADSDELMRVARAWILSGPEAVQPWDRESYLVPGGRPGAPELQTWIATATAALRTKPQACYPAPGIILSCSIAGMSVDFEQADLIETRGFIELVTGSVAKNLLGTFWFQLNSLKAGAERPEGIAPKRFSKIVLSGSDAIRDEVVALLGSRRIETVAAGVSFDVKDVQVCADAQLRVAVGPEDLVLRATMLPISGQPEDTVGLHFFSPLQRTPLVEILEGHETSPQTLAHALDFVLQLGKIPLVVRDGAQFFTRRLQSCYVREGQALLADGQDISLIEEGARVAGFTKPPSVGHSDVPPAASAHLTSGPLALQEVVDRLLFCLAFEAVHMLNEEQLRHVSAGNIGSVMGVGYPRWTGGVFQFLNQYGLSKAVERGQTLATLYGERFNPPSLLIEKAQRKELFN